MSDYILEMDHITKEFSGVKALDDVNLKVKKGEIHAICGENGAGKSTLMKLLTGVYSKDAGQIKIDGMQSSLFMGVTREMTGNSKFDAHSRPTTANVQSINLKMNY